MMMRARTERLLAALLLAVASAAAHAHPCGDKHWLAAPVLLLASGDGAGIGGTGHDERGIGGTGRDGDDRGIGGTGRSVKEAPLTASATEGSGIGGTGIVGVVAGFGSICVNGLEVHFTAATPTRLDGLASHSSALALGQIVSVRAVDLGGGEFRAAEIAVLNAVSGPTEQVDRLAGTLRILGQSVRLPAEALAGIAPGDVLAVSGNRLADGSILATRVMRQLSLAGASLVGPVTDVGRQSFRIGELEVRLAGGPQPLAGEEVFVRGRLEKGVLLAEEIKVRPAIQFARPVERLVIQGFVRQVVAGRLNVDGTLINLAPGVAPALVGGRVEVSARVETDGRIVAERLSLERPATDLRSSRPSQGEAAADPGPVPKLSGLPPFATAVGRDSAGLPAVIDTIKAVPSDALRSSASGAELVRPAAVRPEVSRAELTRPDIARPDVVRPDIVRPEIVRPDIARPEVVRPELVRPEITRPDIPGRGR